jgi:hypothetical protein
VLQPAVSILLPVRNEQRYLPAALDSLFRQTLTSWELVAVDVGPVACGFQHFPQTGIGKGMLAYEQWQNSLSSHDQIGATTENRF